mgnify:CR=1 FL=1
MRRNSNQTAATISTASTIVRGAIAIVSGGSIDADKLAAIISAATYVLARNIPGLLEIALLQRDFERAGSLAERAFELGAKVGPLCRRHWATIQQVRLAAGDAGGAESAARQVEGCTVAGPERY